MSAPFVDPLPAAPSRVVAARAVSDFRQPDGVSPATPAGRGGMAKLSPALRAVATGAMALDAIAPDLATEIMLRHFTRPRRRPGRDYRHLLPPDAQRISLRHQDADLTGWVWPGPGPSVLLVHGWEDHCGSMLGFVAPLRARGYGVCMLDFPGHGLSPRAATHLLDSSRALENLLHHFGRFDHIVAHSFGAAAACLMLSRAPEFEPRRLALVSPMQGLQQHLQIFADIALLSAGRAERLRHRVERLLDCTADEVCALRAIRSLAGGGLVVHDRHDAVIPHTAGESLVRHWSGARLVSTDRLGHRRVLKCPDVLAEIIAYLGTDSSD